MRRFVMRATGMQEMDGGGWVMYEEVRELEAENKQLHEELDKYKPTSQWYVCSECGRTTEDLACCLYDEDEEE